MLDTEDMRRIGGSDVAAIAGLSPYAGPLSVYLRIVDGVTTEDNPATRRGRHLEPAVLSLYAEETGAELLGGRKLIHPAIPYGRASLDAVALRGGVRRVVEVKTAGRQSAARWGEPGTDALPAEYLCQVTWYLGTALALGEVDSHEADVAALLAGELSVYQVQYDADTYAALEDYVRRFWTDHVEPRRPPLPSVGRDAEMIARRFRREETEDTLDYGALPPEARAAIDFYLQAYDEAGKARGRQEALEARVKMLVAGYSGVRNLPEPFGRIDWRAQKGRVDWHAVAASLGSAVTSDAFAKTVEAHTKEGARPFIPRKRKAA